LNKTVLTGPRNFTDSGAYYQNAETCQKYPRDPNLLDKLVIDIAIGEVEDRLPTPEEQGKDPAATALGKKAVRHRAGKITPEMSDLVDVLRGLQGIG
jgi:hypothetical protein